MWISEKLVFQSWTNRYVVLLNIFALFFGFFVSGACLPHFRQEDVRKRQLRPVRIQDGHITTRQTKLSDQFKHVAQPTQGCELPVRAVAASADGPDDEGVRCQWLVSDTGEVAAIMECLVPDLIQ